MDGICHNETLQSICLQDNDLNDIQGLAILNMVKFQAERRDRS